MNKNVLHYWLLEADFPQVPNQGDMGGQGSMMSQPGTVGDPMGQNPPLPPENTPPPFQGQGEQIPDISDDPQYPTMPDTKQDLDFESWKAAYIKESIKGVPESLDDMIMEVRDRDLTEIQRKFVEDNYQINFVREQSNVFQASSKIRKLIKERIDKSYPASTVIRAITSVLDESPMLNEVYIKLTGTGEGKMGYHRKFIAALTGSVQIGSGANNEDLVFEETDYSIRMSTRFNSKWGDVNLGRWRLREDDPQRYLKAAELARLESGSPEEKDVLRRRVVLESIANMFKNRAFVINVVNTEGSIQHLGLDLGNCLKSSYLDGKLVVRTRESDSLEAFIDEEGSIIGIPDMSIYYVKEADYVGMHGKSSLEEIEFIALRDSMLYLTAQVDLLNEASTVLQGITFKETPWQGTKMDLLRISRSVPSVVEMIIARRS